ncbi:uncharacterized protein JCM10292_003383 [Rhodotorula paludigena]|uniref:uncharacterized protein n=1 Tax=Rhodotorula paludigena TaxID=86838 RepID=UPI00317AD46B
MRPVPRADGRHRASSDPLSRGGAFLDGAGLLNQEPNPFEQSFGPQASSSTSSAQKPTDGTASASGRRARSTSPSSLIPRHTPGGSQRLPPLALMQTPGTELSAFGWGDDSLRTGPLSPALLNGPAGGSSLFDASMRTGYTPGVGATSAGGSNAAGVAFPPPSPATAALFAMMTNNTPGTADASAAAALAGGGPRPHEGPNEANSFEASFARANSDNAITSGQTKRAPHHPGETLHRSALANQMNGVMGGSAPAVPQLSDVNGGAGMQTRSTAQHAAPYPAHQQPHPAGGYYPPHAGSGYPPSAVGYPPSSVAYSSAGPSASIAPPPPAVNATQNPLDLLTQASFHNDDAVVAAAALSGLATPGGGGFPAEILAAAQQAGAGAPSVMPGSTVTGGPGALGTHASNGGPPAAQAQAQGQALVAPGAVEGSPAPSAGGSGRAKRGAAAANVNAPPPLQQQGGPPAKRQRKQTAAAAAAIAAEAQGVDDDEEMSGTGSAASKKAPAKRGRKAAAAKKEDDDGATMVGSSVDGGSPPDMGMDGEGDVPAPAANKSGRGRKKDTGETEEEKRRNFLERNRQAALKCRQRKKAWLQSLQTKVELLTTDNDALQSTVNNLKEEVHSLRAILAAHANCPVALGNVPPAPLAPGMAPPPQRGMPGMPPGAHPHQMQPQGLPPGFAPRAAY